MGTGIAPDVDAMRAVLSTATQVAVALIVFMGILFLALVRDVAYVLTRATSWRRWLPATVIVASPMLVAVFHMVVALQALQTSLQLTIGVIGIMDAESAVRSVVTGLFVSIAATIVLLFFAPLILIASHKTLKD